VICVHYDDIRHGCESGCEENMSDANDEDCVNGEDDHHVENETSHAALYVSLGVKSFEDE
jgi:hypothetical protein